MSTSRPPSPPSAPGLLPARTLPWLPSTHRTEANQLSRIFHRGGWWEGQRGGENWGKGEATKKPVPRRKKAKEPDRPQRGRKYPPVPRHLRGL
ncbi:hypothetical protein VULLAG_LOCUS2084 [Vulpes lagopus]